MKLHMCVTWVKRWLKNIFPVQDDEWKKVFLLLFLKFLISFVYCILAALKDTVLVTASHSDAEVISVVKGSIIFPISIGAFLLYAKLNNCCKQTTIFYSTILFFLTLIFIYGFILYPNANTVSPHAMADWLTAYTGGKHLHWIAIFRHWIHVLFFAIAELWGQVVLIVLYWGFVNNICNIYDAKRFYAIIIAAGDVALIITAPLILLYTKKYGHSDFVRTIQSLIGYIMACGVGILSIYWWINRTMDSSKKHVQGVRSKPEKLQLSLWSSLKHVASSRYLLSIAIMVVACGLSINIVEGTWKSYLKELFPTAADYQTCIVDFTFWTGIIALIISLFFSGSMLRKFGWKASASIAPITIGVTGCLFFLMSYAKHNFPALSHWIGPKFIFYIIIFGGIQSIMAKVVKYTFVDATIQIAYIPLDYEIKVKGKAAVDLLGSRLGKAGSSWIQIILLELFCTNSIQPISGILFIFLFVTTILWYRSTDYVSKQLLLLEAQERDKA